MFNACVLDVFGGYLLGYEQQRTSERHMVHVFMCKYFIFMILFLLIDLILA